MSAVLPFGVVDADNHYYEPSDCYTRHLDPAFADRAVRPARAGEDSPSGVMIGSRPFTFLRGGFPGDRETAAQPGALREMLRSMSAGRPVEESSHTHPMQRAYLDRDARLTLMDEQKLERVWLFPTLGVCTEHFLRDDPEALWANVRAFNRWIDDDWGFAYKDRIHAAPEINLIDRDAAIEELGWAIDRGARLIHMLPGPVGGRSPADTYFDPFWARVDEARIGLTLHIGESGYNELFSHYWGEQRNPSSHTQSAFQWTCSYGDRVLMDTVASMIYWNLFGRFPNLRVATIENGSLWVPYILKAMNKYVGMGRHGPWPGGRLDARPADIFKQHFWVSPYHEEDVVALAELIGVDHVLFGSDFPHPEGLAEPTGYTSQLEPLGPDATRAIMRDNALAVMGLD